MTAQRQPDIEPHISDVIHDEEPSEGSGFGDSLRAASPFEDGDVAGLFFPGAGRREALDQFVHLLRYGPSLLVLYGDQGVGKHFLANQLVSQLDPELFDVARVQADVLMNAEALLSGLAGPWHSRTPFSPDTLQQQLVDCANAADDESRVLLLVVQHSQFLDESSIQLLSLLFASCAGLPVKVLLVLDTVDPEEIAQLLPLFDQVPEHYRYQLAPLTRDETADYLAYRLHTGGLGHVHFSAAQVEQIFNLSLGNVLRVNQVAAELLLASLPNKRVAKKKPDLPWMHVGALVTVALVLILLVVTREESGQDGSQPTVMIAADTQPGDVSSVDVASVSESDRRPEPTVPKVVPAERQDKPAGSTTELKPTVAVPQAETTAEKPATPPKTVKTTAEAVKPAPVSEPVPAPVTAPAPVAAKPAAQPVDARRAWVLSLPPEHYALQLLAAKEKATVDAFLALYPSVQKLSYYQTQRNGAPWYVVVQASFPNYDAAKAAVAKLPLKLQKQGPWIRKIEAIQKDLKN